MPKRSKPAVYVIGDLAGAALALERLAALDRRIKAIEADMNTAIDEAKALAAAESVQAKAEIREKEAALAAFSQTQKAELFGKKKSREFPHGFIGFRKSTALKALPKIKMEVVLEKLKGLSFCEAIKTRESVNKEAMREWPEERLQSVGMQRVTKDEFFIELKQETLSASQS